MTGIIIKRMPSLADNLGKPENLPHSTARAGTRLNKLYPKVGISHLSHIKVDTSCSSHSPRIESFVSIEIENLN